MKKLTDEPTQHETAASIHDSQGRESERAVACLLCRSESTRLRKSYDVDVVSRQWIKYFLIDVKDEFRGCSEFHLYECLDCSLLFFDPPALAGSPALYQQLEKGDGYYMDEKWEHAAALEDLRGLNHVLEIGCGFGSFVARGRSQGITGMEGIELNPSAVQTAVGRGVPVRNLELDAVAAESPGRYDAVCAFQVLEHVPDPKPFLATACGLLRPGGKLIIGVPNADSFLRHLSLSLLDAPPHHMTRWSPRALRLLTNAFPLRLERLLMEPLADYHLEMYLQAQGDRIVGDRMQTLPFQRCRALLRRIFRITGIRRLLRGHTVYVCYSKM